MIKSGWKRTGSLFAQACADGEIFRRYNLKLRIGRPDQFWISVASSFLVPSSSSTTTAQPGCFSSLRSPAYTRFKYSLYISSVIRILAAEPRLLCVIHLLLLVGSMQLTPDYELQIRLYREISPQVSPVLFFLAHRDLPTSSWPLPTTSRTRMVSLPIVKTMYVCRP